MRAEQTERAGNMFLLLTTTSIPERKVVPGTVAPTKINMRYFYVLLVIMLSGCIPKDNNKLSHEEKSTEEKINIINFNPEIIEKSDLTDVSGNNLIRLRQNLKDSNEINNYIKNYYALILKDGTICINSSLYYPNINDTKIMYYYHISRDYDNYHVDVSEFTIILENNKSIKVRIFSPLKSKYDIYYFSNGNQRRTKGYYEFGKALFAFENNPIKKIVNKSNIEITFFSGKDEEGYHQYIKLGPISKYYDWVIDIYDYFIIDIYSMENNNEMEIYVNKIIENINFG